MRTRRPRPTPATRSAFAGFRFPPDVIVLASAGTCASACPTATSRSYSPSAGSKSTTLRSTAGCSGSHRCWLRLPAHAGTPSVTAGSSTKPTSKWPGSGAMSIARSTSSGRSSTCWPPPGELPRPPTGSWSGHRHDQGQARRGHHRSGAGVPSGPRGTAGMAWHRTDQYANNRVEADHGRLQAWLRPMRGLKQCSSGMRSSRTFAADTTSWPPRSR
jgi:hypothetical protein